METKEMKSGSEHPEMNDWNWCIEASINLPYAPNIVAYVLNWVGKDREKALKFLKECAKVGDKAMDIISAVTAIQETSVASGICPDGLQRVELPLHKKERVVHLKLYEQTVEQLRKSRNDVQEICEQLGETKLDLNHMTESYKDLEQQVRAVIATCPEPTYVREGGGAENVGASLAVTVMKLVGKLKEAERKLCSKKESALVVTPSTPPEEPSI